MAALIKKNELEKYLRTHKCNKTYIVHIKETLRKKHIYCSAQDRPEQIWKLMRPDLSPFAMG